MIAWIITAAGTGLAMLTSAITQLFARVPQEYLPMMPWWQSP